MLPTNEGWEELTSITLMAAQCATDATEVKAKSAWASSNHRGWLSYERLPFCPSEQKWRQRSLGSQLVKIHVYADIARTF